MSATLKIIVDGLSSFGELFAMAAVIFMFWNKRLPERQPDRAFAQIALAFYVVAAPFAVWRWFL